MPAFYQRLGRWANDRNMANSQHRDHSSFEGLSWRSRPQGDMPERPLRGRSKRHHGLPAEAVLPETAPNTASIAFCTSLLGDCHPEPTLASFSFNIASRAFSDGCRPPSSEALAAKSPHPRMSREARELGLSESDNRLTVSTLPRRIL